MKKETSLSSDNVDQQAYRIAFLISGFLQDRLSPEEHRELDDWVTASMENQRLFEELTDPAILVAGKADLQKSRPDELLEHVKGRLHFTEPPRLSLFRRIWPYMAAACLLIGVLLFWVKMQNKNSHLGKVPGEWAAKDLPPGSNKATLTLADGTTRQLDSSAKGMLATQGGAFVMKDDSDRLVYETGTSNPTAEPVFNILRVPQGGQYQLRLPDGTKVWLNADSYLKYPTTFTGKDRKVELSGEGYFEVTENPLFPFSVQAEGVVTLVFGTHFNVNTYPEKKTIQITLAEGAIKVLPPASGTPQKGQLLRPGQQALVDRSDGSLKIVPANLRTTLAWKDGRFTFQNTPLEDVLGQIKRWYNVEIADKTTDADHFNATISRDVPVSKLLHMLEQTRQVHFHIDSSRITVTN